jgi:anaerobic magnesium-protoporphyrin IX monomethyl ester cyclase
LDSLPFPARHLLDLSSYHREVEGKKVTSVITSRGCPYTCNFCCKDVHGTKVRLRGVDDVINEIKEIKKNYGFESFIFYDDIFTLYRKRLSNLCDQLKDLNITFRCNGRAGINTFEDYVKLKEAGCEEIAFGIESGSQKILDKINKRTTVEKNIESIINAKKAGLTTKAFLIVGFPGESQKTVNETKAFMNKANPDKFTVFAFVPLPGCDVWKHPKEYGILKMSDDWDQFFNIAGNYEGGYSFTTKELDFPKIQMLHDDLVSYLLNRGENYGQKGKLEKYYDKLNLKK